MARLVKVYANLEAYKDRHGKQRYYFRKTGSKRIPIKGEFGSHEFDANYEKAKAKSAGIEILIVGKSSVQPGTINDLCVRYYRSYEFKTLKAKTQKNYRRQIEAFREVVGNTLVKAITRRHFEQIKADMSDRPGACRTFLKRLNTLFNFAVSEEMREGNPMAAVKLPAEGAGFTPWTDDEIEAFLSVWKEGTRERLGLYLCLFTGQRRSDIVAMGEGSVREVDGQREIEVVQEKTGKHLWIPMHPELSTEIDRQPKGQSAFLVNPRTGEPLSSEGFGNWLRGAAKDVPGIDGTRGPHGLRKAAARRLIEAGCDGETARAITGHASEKELAIYIKDVSQQKLARRAMEAMTADEKVRQTRRKSNEIKED